MNEHDESDSSVVPEKQANKAARAAAEPVEGRELAKGNPREQHASRTQRRVDAPGALERIREAARRDKKLRFTALLHHVYDADRLRAAYQELNPGAAAGIDGVTWEQYGQQLEHNLQELSERLKRGAYRARPARRVRIPKPDGRERLLGVPALEDKVVQRATADVLEAIYEQDFLGFSYGFRRGRNAHHALDAVSVGIRTRKVGWVLDADIRAFFDTLDHGWLVKFLEHRIADKRVIHLIQKWLKAGVLEDGKRVGSELGTVQGGSISPVLANIYLHYVLDLWTQQWRSKQAHGDVIIVRYCDDFVVGFQYRNEAEQYLEQLRRRFEHFGLELHADKTRLIEFGRFAALTRAKRGAAKPETFNFLGLTHFCAQTRRGWFAVGRKTIRQRWQAKLREVHAELRRRMHDPVPDQGRYVQAVTRGHANYYGVPGNSRAITAFRSAVIRIWRRTLSRRSQKGLIAWKRMARLVARWVPNVRLRYLDPDGHLRVMTQGRSPVR
jgi:group II intron reverse transcriptase/maturase